MTRSKFLLLLSAYILFLSALFLYSFTQIDLNLTISRNNLFQEAEKLFLHFGYYERPLSTALFGIISLGMFFFYFLLIILSVRRKISLKKVGLLLIVTVIILLFAYPAFSHDIFNYLFDARIISFYHQNPYLHKALDYPADPWIRFMHWTHRTYPYGPFWLVLTVPLSYLGAAKFLPTLYLFKLLAAGCYLLSAYLIYKIAQDLKIRNPLISLVLFAFNPLVVIECLVSAHNDIVMMALALAGLYFFQKKRVAVSFLMLVISAGIKFVTAALLPLWLVFLLPEYFPSLSLSKLILRYQKYLLPFTFYLLTISLIYYLLGHEFQPWYFLWIFPFGLLLNNKFLNISLICLSLGLLIRYLPFLFTGGWDFPVSQINNNLTFYIFLAGILSSFSLYLKNKLS